MLIWLSGASFVLAMLYIKLLQPIAIKLNYLDYANHRKLHNIPVAMTGGLAVFITTVCILPFVAPHLNGYYSLFFGSFLFLSLGLVDDLKSLPAKMRMLLQLSIIFFLILAGHVEIINLGYLISNHTYLHSGALFTAFAILTMINATNMLDGQDGLVGGVTIIQLGWIAFIAYQFGMSVAFNLLVIIITSIFGFLVFNFRWPWVKQASVFMGDAGSTMLGFITVWFAIHISQSTNISTINIHPVTFLWILALPIFDVSMVSFKRLGARKSPLSPDRSHIHHLLQNCNFKVLSSTIILYISCFLFGAIGFFGSKYNIAADVLFVSFAVLWLINITLSFMLGRSKIVT